MILAASWMDESGLTVTGSFVITSRRLTDFGSWPSPTTFSTSRSVTMPESELPSMMRSEPVCWARIFAAASARVSSAASVTAAFVIRSETFIGEPV
jgi:hypothetical protein